jgi:hypothetical protein
MVGVWVRERVGRGIINGRNRKLGDGLNEGFGGVGEG